MTNMEVKLVSADELQRLIREQPAEEPETPFRICPITEPMMLSDLVKKQRCGLRWEDFVYGWNRVFPEHIHYVPVLDSGCLQETLFVRSEDHRIEGFWPEGVERGKTPSRRMRRLVMRPGPQNDWDFDSYKQCEEWFDESRHG